MFDPAMNQDFFTGEWVFEREIITKGILTGRAKGTAVFTTDEGNRLLYNERGELGLTDNGSTFSFFRSFIYEFETNQLTLIYNDGANIGQHYQTYQPEGERLVSLTPHICGPDVYDGYFEKLSANSYKQYVKVVGEKKDYEVVTVYGRIENLKHNKNS
jgi:hypothetical protein